MEMSSNALLALLAVVGSLIFLLFVLNAYNTGKSSESSDLFSLIAAAKEHGKAVGSVTFIAETNLRTLIEYTLGDVNCSRYGYCIVGKSLLEPGTYRAEVWVSNEITYIRVS